MGSLNPRSDSREADKGKFDIVIDDHFAIVDLLVAIRIECGNDLLGVFSIIQEGCFKINETDRSFVPVLVCVYPEIGSDQVVRSQQLFAICFRSLQE